MTDRLRGFRRSGAVSCVCVCVLAAPVGPLEAGQDLSDETRQLVQALGIGVPVIVRLPSTTDLRGVIDDISENDFVLQEDRQRRRLRYDQIQELTLPSMKYQASGQTDAVAVQRILYVVGTGNQVRVKTRGDSRTMRGTIQNIEASQFTLVSNNRPLTLSYEQVAEVEAGGGGLHWGWKVGIGAAVAGISSALLVLLSYNE